MKNKNVEEKENVVEVPKGVLSKNAKGINRRDAILNSQKRESGMNGRSRVKRKTDKGGDVYVEKICSTASYGVHGHRTCCLRRRFR